MSEAGASLLSNMSNITLTLPNGTVELALRHTLVFSESSPSNNVIKGMHPQVYKQLRNKWRGYVKAQVPEGTLTPIEQSFLIIERFSAGSGLDWDNAYGGLKPILDCLVRPSVRNPDGVGLIVDDNASNMPFPPYVLQHSAKKGEGKLIIRVYEIVSRTQNNSQGDSNG